jgi:hypothetical protein
VRRFWHAFVSGVVLAVAAFTVGVLFILMARQFTTAELWWAAAAFGALVMLMTAASYQYMRAYAL